MGMTISVSAVTATSVTLSLNDVAPDGTVDLQISPRLDFAFCVCPILSIGRASPVTINGLNQRATLFARARARRANGTVEDWSPIEPFRTSDSDPQDTAPAPVMIEPAVVMLPEKVLTWIPSALVVGFPADNLGRDAPVGWKVAGAGNQHVDARLAGMAIDTIAVLNTNMPEAGAVTIYAAPTQGGLDSGVGRVALATSAPFRASPDLPGRLGYHGLFRFAPTALPWWRIIFEGQRSADTLYVEHVLFGWNRTTKNHSIDKTETPLPKSTIDRTRSGIPDRVSGLPMRKVEFDISVMTEAQYETTYADLVYQENEAVFVLPNSKDGAFLHDRMLYGDLKGSRIFNPSSPFYTRTFGIESII